MVQKILPWVCYLGPKFPPSCWSLVRKKNDDLAVQYEDVHDYVSIILDFSDPPDAIFEMLWLYWPQNQMLC